MKNLAFVSSPCVSTSLIIPPNIHPRLFEDRCFYVSPMGGSTARPFLSLHTHVIMENLALMPPPWGTRSLALPFYIYAHVISNVSTVCWCLVRFSNMKAIVVYTVLTFVNNVSCKISHFVNGSGIMGKHLAFSVVFLIGDCTIWRHSRPGRPSWLLELTSSCKPLGIKQ